MSEAEQLARILTALHRLRVRQEDAERDANAVASFIIQEQRAYLMNATNARHILWSHTP